MTTIKRNGGKSGPNPNHVISEYKMMDAKASDIDITLHTTLKARLARLGIQATMLRFRRLLFLLSY